MLKKLCFLMSVIFLISLTSASLGTFKQSDCIPLYQYCDDCTYVNLTKVTYPNGTILTINSEMTKDDVDYNYTFCGTNTIGTYYYTVKGDKDGEVSIERLDFEVTKSGQRLELNQTQTIFGLGLIMSLFVVLGFSFPKTKWKVRSFFFILALLMGTLILNSVRIVASASEELNIMMVSGLVIGITVLLFMFLYLFIYAMIEVFRYFKKRNIKKWDISENPY